MQRSKLSVLKRVFFTSPWLIPLFFVVPVFVIANLRLHIPVSADLLLYNNGCCALILAARALHYLAKSRSEIRYGAERAVPEKSLAVGRPVAVLQEELAQAGYRFIPGGRYGEKRDLGYLGTALLYLGLTVLLAVGSYDYMREYSIMVRLGVGLPFPLDGKGLTGEFEAGALAATSTLPELKVKQQILPDAKYPQGATEIVLLTKEGKELATSMLAPGTPFRYGGLDYNMIKYLFDGLIVIREDKFIVFDEFVKFLPLQKKYGQYSYYAKLYSRDSKVHGHAWLAPEKKGLKVQATLNGKTIVDTELELWGVNKKTQDRYQTSFEGLAQWSELRVARGRHRTIMMIGGMLALLGAALRLAVRPRRVWLEEDGAGSRVKVCGSEPQKLLCGDGAR